MVYSDNIVKFIRYFESVNPPGKFILFHFVPIVYRVSPKLTVFGKQIGRNSRYQNRIEVFIEKIIVGRRPNVYAVVSDVNRHISYDFYTFGVGVFFQTRKLSVKLVLSKFPKLDASRVFSRQRGYVYPELFFFIPFVPFGVGAIFLY